MANLDTIGITNSKLYYGIVCKVYEDDTADVLTYSYIRVYEPDVQYWAGDIISYNNNYYYINNSHIATATSFEDYPQFFTLYTPLSYNKNVSNPSKEVKYILPKCKIFININDDNTATNNKINGSYRWLCVGTPVIVMKKIDEFIIVHFGKIDQALIDAGFVKNSFYMFDYGDQDSLFFIYNNGSTRTYSLTTIDSFGNLAVDKQLPEFYNNFDPSFKQAMMDNLDTINRDSVALIDNKSILINTPLGDLSNYSHSIVTTSVVFGNLNRALFGKYLFFDRGYYPYNIDGLVSIDETILNTFYFFLEDNTTSDLYFVIGIVYEDKTISFKYILMDYNYPLLGKYFYSGFDSITNISYDFSSILPYYTSWNFIADLGNSYTYTNNNCDNINLFFGLLTLYPQINDGVFSLSYSYNETSGQWSGVGYNGSTGSINITNNGEAQSYLFEYDNTYYFNNKTLYEFHGIDKDGSGNPPLLGDYRRFRFGSGRIETNSDGSPPSNSYIEYIKNYNHFPFSLRKCVYKVEVPPGGTNSFTINNLDPDIPQSGYLISGFIRDDYEIDLGSVVDYTISDTTLTSSYTWQNSEAVSQYVDIVIFFLYYLDKPIQIPQYLMLDNKYYNINSSSVFSHNIFWNNKILSLLTMTDNINNVVKKMAFFYNGTTIYDIEADIDNNISSDYLYITYSAYRNMGLLTNFMK